MMARSLDKLRRSKSANITKDNTFKVALNEIHEMEGFNPRDYNDPETQEHIRAFAESFAAGRYVPPIEVTVVDGKIYVVEGHCRRRGALMAVNELGVELGLLSAIEIKGDDNERDARIVTAQSGKPISPLGLAKVYQRMINRGKTVAEIAEYVSKTQQHVRQVLDMHTMPEDVKALVRENKISASSALNFVNEHGTDAINIIKEGLALAEAKGKTRVTNKTLNQVVTQQSAATDKAEEADDASSDTIAAEGNDPAQKQAEERASREHDKAPEKAKTRPLGKRAVSMLSAAVSMMGTKLADATLDKEGGTTLTLARRELQMLRHALAELPEEEEELQDSQESLYDDMESSGIETSFGRMKLVKDESASSTDGWY